MTTKTLEQRGLRYAENFPIELRQGAFEGYIAGAKSEQEICIAAINAEPELPDEMPDEMYFTICSSPREGITKILRMLVKITKQEIVKRIQETL